MRPVKLHKKILVPGLAVLLLLAGCAKEKPADNPKNTPQGAAPAYKDGTYHAESGADDRGAVGHITLTIQQGKIVQAEFKGVQKDGKVKDVEYGKTNGKIENQEFYNKAQVAVKGMATYAPKLVEVQDIDKVDSVSGATVSYKQFVDAGKKALEQAKK